MEAELMTESVMEQNPIAAGRLRRAMGGGAFETTKRLSRAELDALSAAVVARVEAAVPGAVVRMPAELTDKTSFGDLDLIFTVPDIARRDDVLAAARDAVAATAEAPSKAVHSFLSSAGHQVDLEMTSNLPLALFCKANGDACCLLNLFLRRHGLKLHDGGLLARAGALRATVDGPDGPVNVELPDLLLTDDAKLIGELLGLDTDGQTPRSKAQVFAALSASRVFAAGALEAHIAVDADSSSCQHSACNSACRNKKSRYRANQRPMFGEYLAWLATRSPATTEPGLDLMREVLAATGRAAAARDALAAAAATALERRCRKLCSERLGALAVEARCKQRAMVPPRGAAMGAVLARVRGDAGWRQRKAFLDRKETTQADVDALLDRAIDGSDSADECAAQLPLPPMPPLRQVEPLALRELVSALP